MIEKNKGFFICFEGIDGAGKTTQIKRLAAYLQSVGLDVVYTREPGGTPYAEMIRTVLFNPPEGEVICPITDLLLFFAARNQHLYKVIKPEIDAGKIVLCDRFLISSYAYQVAGENAPSGVFYELTNLVISRYREVLGPLHTFLFNVSDTISRERITQRSGGIDRWDSIDAEKRKRINDHYRQCIDMYGIVDIDAEPNEDVVFKTTLTAFINIAEENKYLKTSVLQKLKKNL